MNSKGNAVCCGTSAWLNCGTYSKRTQVDRLKEARATGSRTMVTACPKCLIHFRCTQVELEKEEPPIQLEIEVKDLSSVLAEALRPEGVAR